MKAVAKMKSGLKRVGAAFSSSERNNNNNNNNKINISNISNYDCIY